jgi:hypothetical protein
MKRQEQMEANGCNEQVAFDGCMITEVPAGNRTPGFYAARVIP